MPLVLAWALWTVGPRALLRVRWSLHLLRGVLGIAMMASFVYALKRLPLSTAYSIFFVAPLLITALSVPILGEKVGPRRWSAIAVGLVGVLVVLRPTVSAITVRVLARTDPSQAITFWLLALMALGAGALALPGWVPLRAQDLWIVGGIGVAGAIGQYAITEAFRLAEASRVAPLEYSALVWGLLLDLTLWGVLPDAVTWIGAAIIIASGLYLIRREKVQGESTHAEAEHP